MSEKRFCPLAKLYRTDYELENGGRECDAEKCAWGVQYGKTDICALFDTAYSLDAIFQNTRICVSKNHEASI